MAEIYPGVVVGGWSAAREHGLSFDCVFNCACDAPHTVGSQYQLVDGPGNPINEFRRAVFDVAKAIDSGQRILVHCVAGHSRSLVVAVAALAVLKKVEFEPFLLEAKKKRPSHLPDRPHIALITVARQILGSCE